METINTTLNIISWVYAVIRSVGGKNFFENLHFTENQHEFDVYMQKIQEAF